MRDYFLTVSVCLLILGGCKSGVPSSSAEQQAQLGGASDDIKKLLTENSPRSRSILSGYLEEFLRDLDQAPVSEKPSGDFEFLRTTVKITAMMLENPNKKLCDEEEKLTFYRGLPAHSLSSLDPLKAVIVAQGFSTTKVPFSQVMRNYARTRTDPKDFGNSSPPPGTSQIAGVAPFSFIQTGSRHSLAVASRESPYISFSVFPFLASSFAPENGFLATIKVCPGRMWSTAEGGFSDEGEFLLPLGSLPGEITALTKVNEGNREAINNLPSSSVSGCFFNDPGIGDKGIFKETSVRVLTDFNRSLLGSASGAAINFDTYESFNFAGLIKKFIKDKCNCPHQVNIFKAIADARNVELRAAGMDPTFVPGDDFCKEFGSGR
jgi:hypothetical protein